MKGFFAYSNQSRVSDTITDFAQELNSGGLIKLETWEEMNIGGKLLISEICKKIRECDVFFADITMLNPNVLFEIGYAIATKKRIWLVRDSSITSENNDFKQFRTLTTLGYREYLNSKDLIKAYYNDLPHEDLSTTVYDEIISQNIINEEESHLFYLKSYYNDQASVKIAQTIDQKAKKTSTKLIVDDPNENGIQPLAWYARNVFYSNSVICHLTSLDRNDSKIQNAKHSLVAGLAHGFDITTLLLIDNNLFGPTDYRDLLYSYKKSSDAVAKVESFLNPIEVSVARNQMAHQLAHLQKREVEELSRLRIGEPIAEHENINTLDDAFVETSSYKTALEGDQTIFVGRKGVGKTANFKKLARECGKDTRNVVCEIAPLSYELESLVQVAKKFEKIAKGGYLFESLWKFLLYSELSKLIYDSIKLRPSGLVFDNEKKLVDLIEERQTILNLDFSARLDSLAAELLKSNIVDELNNASSLAISEILHNDLISKLISYTGSAMKGKQKITVLVDNLDKAWDKNEDSVFLSYFFLGLLSAQRRFTNDFRGKIESRHEVSTSLCVFVRADIFDFILGVAREPDKINYKVITWDDKETLKLIADTRLCSTSKSNIMRSDELWEKFFVVNVFGTPVFDYIYANILPRPRDLLTYLRSLIYSAISKRRGKIEEPDFVKASEEYSDFAYQSLLVESREGFPEIESILEAFLGHSSILKKSELMALINGDNSFQNKLIEHLALCSFLEIEVPSKGFYNAKTHTQYKQYSRAAENKATKLGSEIRFRIHPAFWPILILDSEL